MSLATPTGTRPCGIELPFADRRVRKLLGPRGAGSGHGGPHGRRGRGVGLAPVRRGVRRPRRPRGPGVHRVRRRRRHLPVHDARACRRRLRLRRTVDGRPVARTGRRRPVRGRRRNRLRGTARRATDPVRHGRDRRGGAGSLLLERHPARGGRPDPPGRGFHRLPRALRERPLRGLLPRLPRGPSPHGRVRRTVPTPEDRRGGVRPRGRRGGHLRGERGSALDRRDTGLVSRRRRRRPGGQSPVSRRGRGRRDGGERRSRRHGGWRTLGDRPFDDCRRRRGALGRPGYGIGNGGHRRRESSG